MTAKEKDYGFSGYDASRNEYNCNEGQLELGNYSIGADGSIHPTLMARLARGIYPESVIAWHEGHFLLWEDGSLSWCLPDDDVRHLLTYVTYPESVAIKGRCIVITQTDGIMFYLWTGNRYTEIQQVPAAPTVEFGVQAEGSLGTVADVVVDAEAVTTDTDSDSGTGSGASSTHPSTETATTTASEQSHATVMDVYEAAVGIGAEAKGLFMYPFFVRYALRSHDDVYLYVSPPVLMLPSVLPPGIAVDNVRDLGNGSAVVDLDMSTCRVHQLRARMSGTLDEGWHHLAAAVDILVSPQVRTYIGDFSRVGVSTYTAVARQTCDGAGSRGRQPTSTSPIFAGNFSEGDDVYADHFLSADDLRRRVWNVQPNTHLCSGLTAAGEFYRVASYSLEAFEAMTQFTAIAIESTAEADFKGNRRLTATEECNLHVCPSALYYYNSQLFAAGGGFRLNAPGTLRQLCSCRDGTGDGQEEVTVRVLCRYNEQVYTASSRCQYGASLRDSFPRYVYYPDRRAYMMQICCGDDVYALPLTPHEGMAGAFWFGGLDSAHTPSPAVEVDLAQAADSAYVSAGNRLFVSEVGNDHAFREVKCMDVGDGRIVAVRSALRAPGAGLFGKYPLYAFATDGVWMLDHSSDSGTITAVRKLADTPCLNPASVSAVGAGVVFGSGDRIMEVSGSAVSALLSGKSFDLFDVGSLPDALRIPGARGMSRGIDVSACATHFVGALGKLLVYQPGRDMCLVYDMDSKCISTAEICIRNEVAGLPDDMVATCRPDSAKPEVDTDATPSGQTDVANTGAASCGISRIVMSDEDVYTLIVTRPLRLSQIMPRKRISAVSVWTHHRQLPCMVALYGADHADDWRLVGTSRSHFLPVNVHRRYRRYRLLISAKLPTNPLYGFSIIFD